MQRKNDNDPQSQENNTEVKTECVKEEKKKSKRKCLRLDFGHHRNIFVATFYRIWMYRRRHILVSLLQILIPPLMLVGMIAYLGTVLKIENKPWTTFNSATEQELYDSICGTTCTPTEKSVMTCFIEHSNTVFSRKFESELTARLLASNIDLNMVPNKAAIRRHALKYHLRGESQKYLGGLEIYNPAVDPPGASSGIGSDFKLKFTLIMSQKSPSFSFEQASAFFNLDNHKPESYFQLLGIEMTVLKTFRKLILNEQATTEKIKEIDVQSLSYPPHHSFSVKDVKYSGQENDIDKMLISVFVLSMVPVFFTVVEGPVTEKENGFKLYLMLMGYPRGAYWFSWILNQMLIQLLIIFAQVWLLFSSVDPNIGPLVKQGDFSLWFVMLVLFNMSSLSFFIFIAAFCRRGKMATYLGILIWLLSFHLLEAHMPSLDLGSALSSFLVCCLVPSGSLHWAVLILTQITSDTWEIGLTLPLTHKSGFTLSDVMLMMIADFFIYFLLTLYVDNLSPGPLEYSQPWNYFFEGIRCRFIDPNRNLLHGDRGTNDNQESTADGTSQALPNAGAAIEFKNISKKFYLIDGIYGIENVKFTAYSNSITVLLGHNDSGRTTLMRLVCGEYSPSSGTVCVFGYNVRRQTQRVQSFLSVCMEKDLLCEYLTVMEHMRLVGKLKGLTAKEAEKQAKIILESVGMLSQVNEEMWKLVIWERRVLCVAMALVGNSPILLLDEPTKNLDMDTKRRIWSLMKELRTKGKTILMSTDNIQEAYEVADRIVIMSKGRIAGVGTPPRLEWLFDTGYHLYLSLIPSSTKDEIISFLRGYIPSVRESEGSLRKVSKAINCDWDTASKSYIHDLTKQVPEYATVVNIPETSREGSVLLKVIDSIANKNLTRQESEPTICHMISESNLKSSSGEKGSSIERVYILPFREKNNFPSLFNALSNAANAVRLGISKFDVRLYNMEKAFDEVDDFVELLNATKSTIDFEVDNFEDMKALRLPMEDVAYFPLPSDTQQIKLKRQVCSGCRTIWALLVKRVYHLISNYRHVIIQILAPIIILIITIHSTNVHFEHNLFSQVVTYNGTTRSASPVVPYRFIGGAIAQDMFSSFQRVIQKQPYNIRELRNIGTSDFTEYYNQNNRYKLHDEVIIGADFTQADAPANKVTALFSPAYHHSAPVSLLIMFNAILDYEFPSKGYDIQMSVKTMQHETQNVFLTNSSFINSLVEKDAHITFTVSLAFGYYIFTSGFVSQACAERVSKLKRYQLNIMLWNGLYWISAAMIDLLLNWIVIGALIAVMFYETNHEVFKDPQFIILFLITGALGGFASLIMSYILSHYLIKTSTCYYATLSINQFLGLFTFLLYTIFNFEHISSYTRTIVSFCLQIIQPFTIPWNFYNAILCAFHNARCTVLHSMAKEEMCSSAADNFANIDAIRGECCKPSNTMWSVEFIKNDTKLWGSCAILLAHCVATVFFLVFLERRQQLLGKLFQILSHVTKPPKLKDPKDLQSIKNEEIFVEHCEAAEDPDEHGRNFIIKKLGMTSGFTARYLLSDITFATEPGKCTAIVGPPTSCLTILFETLSGLRPISEGKVTYCGYSLFSWNTRKRLLYQMGFCPAEDITIEKISGLQLLKLFGRLRGICPKALNSHVDHWVQTLSLQKMIKKRCQSYSPIVKKKLAVAMACIGNPPIVIFDDPTSNLDPVSRLQVCGVLESLVHANRVVIVLTHDLASIQRICSKLIFLVNGQIQHCGNPEAIYKEISREFTLNIKLKGDETGRIDFKTYTDFKTTIEKNIDSITLLEELSHSLSYLINSEKYQWASLFETVEKITSQYPTIIQDYFLRKASLEDMYNAYAAKQRVIRKTTSAWDEFRTTYC